MEKLQHSNIMNVLNKVIRVLASHEGKSFEDVMENCIRPVADMVNFDRVVIYNKMNNEKFGQFYRWESGSGTMPINEIMRILPPIPAVQQWFSILNSGEKLVRRLDKMSEEEISFANMIGIKSIILVPIFRHGEMWGTISFQDHTNQRDFDEYFDLLDSIANLYSDAVIKEKILQKQKENIEELEHLKKMSDTLNKAAIAFISQSEESHEVRMTDGLRLVCDMANIDRVSVWRNIPKPDGLYASQIYRWDRESGGTTKPTKGLEDIAYSRFAPRWKKLLSDNQIINGPANLMPEAAMLKTFGVVSALVIPLIVKNAFIGFVLFEDRRKERYFEDDYVEMMRSTAFLCMNTVIRVEMEREIQKVNKANNILLNEASIGIVILDENGSVIDCNDKILKILDCTKQYVLKHFFDLFPKYQPDGKNSLERAREILKQVLNEGRMAFEWVHQSTSGELIPCEINIVSANYMDKTVCLGYIYDVRNIKKMQAVVNEAQEMARAIMEASPISYILFDENYNVINCNEIAMKIFECTDKQYFLDNYWKNFSIESEKVKSIITKAINEGKQHIEWTHKTFNGELLPMENTISPFTFNGKKFVISFKYDLREHKKMIRHLALRLEQQQFISEISKDFISFGDSYMIIDEALSKLGKILSVSRMFIFYMDYEHSDTYAAYQWYADYDVPKFQDSHNFDLFKMIETIFPKELSEGGNIPIFSCADVNDGSKFNLLKTNNITSCIRAPIYVEGKLWGTISAENCFTFHEWSEDDISFFKMASSIIAGAIMRNLYEIKIKEMLDKVTRLSKAKDEFLSKISHEIRTPLNAIIGVTEIQLRDETLTNEKRESLNIVYNSGDSLLHIINDLLDLSKLEAKKLEIMPVKYEIANLINDTVQLNITRIEGKLVEFKLHLDENIPSELIGDEQRIKQILNNILSNAFKYTSAGEVSMSVSVEKYKSEDYDTMLIFCVKDTGQGMTEEQVRKVFDEYSRFNLSENISIEGTGLGMSIVQNLINLMGGKISVESELGKGSVFTINLPQKIARVKILDRETSEDLQNLRMVSSSQTKKMQIVRESMPYGKILIVDDVESNLYVAKRLLDPYDLSLETTSNGFEAIEEVKRGKIYDIIFMDHMMPGMDGIETTKIIRDLGYKHPIVALTANAIAGQAEIFLKNGFDGFIFKPIDTRQLNAELNRFIRDKRIAPVPTKTVSTVNTKLLAIFAQDAKRCLPIFEKMLENATDATDEDWELFTINAHGMKSALANIGETELSEIALALEKTSNVRDKNTIGVLTQELVNSLKKILA